ncbi:hypothetical protein POTOM_010976 [Populus tomentosa]|uniref:Uncharacterized protein n=1 Tax=Populus tomentosa TaxID=118781 RepID=A0A8X8AE86_POPTO|nr:hypothetical protein POTOM_010976 [Populus tomentosa]
MDGSFNVESSGARVVLTNPEGHDCTYEVRFKFSATNNVVEYEAFSTRLGLVEALYAYPLQGRWYDGLFGNDLGEFGEVFAGFGLGMKFVVFGFLVP